MITSLNTKICVLLENYTWVVGMIEVWQRVVIQCVDESEFLRQIDRTMV